MTSTLALVRKNWTHLKLAVSIHSQPILTAHLTSAFSGAIPESEEHDLVFSGCKNPLSRANCSRQIGRKSVRETTTKASLAMASETYWREYERYTPSKCITEPSSQPLLVCGRHHDIQASCVVHTAALPHVIAIHVEPLIKLVEFNIKPKFMYCLSSVRVISWSRNIRQTPRLRNATGLVTNNYTMSLVLLMSTKSLQVASTS
jgi:hypothetical protein